MVFFVWGTEETARERRRNVSGKGPRQKEQTGEVGTGTGNTNTPEGPAAGEGFWYAFLAGGGAERGEAKRTGESSGTASKRDSLARKVPEEATDDQEYYRMQCFVVPSVYAGTMGVSGSRVLFYEGICYMLCGRCDMCLLGGGLVRRQRPRAAESGEARREAVLYVCLCSLRKNGGEWRLCVSCVVYVMRCESKQTEARGL